MALFYLSFFNNFDTPVRPLSFLRSLSTREALMNLTSFFSNCITGQTKSHFPDEAPGWEEVLASDSEAVVKAERAGNKTIKEMQEETVECLHNENGECAGNPDVTQEKR